MAFPCLMCLSLIVVMMSLTSSVYWTLALIYLQFVLWPFFLLMYFIFFSLICKVTFQFIKDINFSAYILQNISPIVICLLILIRISWTHRFWLNIYFVNFFQNFFLHSVCICLPAEKILRKPEWYKYSSILSSPAIMVSGLHFFSLSRISSLLRGRDLI